MCTASMAVTPGGRMIQSNVQLIRPVNRSIESHENRDDGAWKISRDTLVVKPPKHILFHQSHGF